MFPNYVPIAQVETSRESIGTWRGWSFHLVDSLYNLICIELSLQVFLHGMINSITNHTIDVIAMLVSIGSENVLEVRNNFFCYVLLIIVVSTITTQNLTNIAVCPSLTSF